LFFHNSFRPQEKNIFLILCNFSLYLFLDVFNYIFTQSQCCLFIMFSPTYTFKNKSNYVAFLGFFLNKKFGR